MNTKMDSNKNSTLFQEEQELIKKYQKLQQEEKIADTVINCQVKKDEIQEQKKDIEQKLYEIKGKLLKENEEYVKKNKIDSK